jgi:hypothetical protein
MGCQYSRERVLSSENYRPSNGVLSHARGGLHAYHKRGEVDDAGQIVCL